MFSIRITGYGKSWKKCHKDLMDKRMHLTLEKIVKLKTARKIGDIEENTTNELLDKLNTQGIAFEYYFKEPEKETLKLENIHNCIYCGSKAEVISISDPGERTKDFVECTNNDCLASGPLSNTTIYKNAELAKIEAIAKWNQGQRYIVCTG